MSGTGRVTRKWLIAQGDAIHDEWEGRLKSQTQRDVPQAPVKPYDKANGYLKREVYRLVRCCLAKDAIDLLQLLVMREDSAPRPTAYNERDPFYWGFMFIVGMDERVSRQDRGRFANELLYAQKHNVPPELLIGFISQIGKSDGLRERLLSGQMEEWHKNS